MEIVFKNSKPHLYIVSSIGGSIWEITSDLLPHLEKEFIVTKEWMGELPVRNDILLCHFLNPGLFLQPDIFDSFKTKILIQPIDGTSIKKEIVQMLNCFDLILTPSDAGKKIMIKNNVQVPIQVIPNYYKPDLFEKNIWTDIENYIPKDKIIFYHESTFHPRKGIEILYEGFIRAFANTEDWNKVVLVVKDLSYNLKTFEKNETLKTQAVTLQKKFKRPPTILKLSCFLEENELKSLWNLADVYVSFAKIEGFGIPLLRMFLMNKPVITLSNQNSGYLDYLNNGNAYLVDTINTIAKDEFMWLYDDQTQWATPNMNDVVKTFRKCLSDIKKGNTKSMKSNAFTLDSNWRTYFEKYSFENISKTYIAEIKEVHELNIKNDK